MKTSEITENERMILTKYDLYFESRLSKVESAISHIDKRMDIIDKRIDGMDKRIDGLDQRMSDGFKEMKSDFKWLVLIMLSGFGTLFGLMAHCFKWF